MNTMKYETQKDISSNADISYGMCCIYICVFTDVVALTEASGRSGRAQHIATTNDPTRLQPAEDWDFKLWHRPFLVVKLPNDATT